MRKSLKSRHKENTSERWLVSYADMLTLLLGLFVVLYASKQDGVSEEFVHDSLVKVMMNKESGALEKFSSLPDIYREELGYLKENNEIEINVSNKYIEIIVFDENIFEIGSAELNYDAVEPLLKLSGILKDSENRVVIEGHTDSLLINGGLYPSNWELSASRAASVLRFFEQEGVDSIRMSIIGFSSNVPVDSNETSKGRSRNRRVVVKVLRDFKNGK